MQGFLPEGTGLGGGLDVEDPGPHDHGRRSNQSPWEVTWPAVSPDVMRRGHLPSLLSLLIPQPRPVVRKHLTNPSWGLVYEAPEQPFSKLPRSWGPRSVRRRDAQGRLVSWTGSWDRRNVREKWVKPPKSKGLRPNPCQDAPSTRKAGTAGTVWGPREGPTLPGAAPRHNADSDQQEAAARWPERPRR